MALRSEPKLTGVDLNERVWKARFVDVRKRRSLTAALENILEIFNNHAR